MKVIIIGRTEILYSSALMLKEEHQICGIITAKASPEYEKTQDDFELLAKELGCPFLQTQYLGRAASEFIINCKPDVGVSVNWVSVINSKIIDLLPFGILNCHPGDLPYYRGNAVCNWAMLAGETEIVVTIHEMVAGELDSGAIYCQDRFKISEDSDITDFVKFWESVTPNLFLEAINKISTLNYRPLDQATIEREPFRCFPRLPVDSKIDWAETARNIDLLIKASAAPYSGAYTYLKIGDIIHKVSIWNSRVVQKDTVDMGTPGHIIFNDKQSGESHVYTGAGVLAIGDVSFDNEDSFRPGLVWKSIRMRFGIDIEQEIILLNKRLNGEVH